MIDPRPTARPPNGNINGLSTPARTGVGFVVILLLLLFLVLLGFSVYRRYRYGESARAAFFVLLRCCSNKRRRSERTETSFIALLHFLSFRLWGRKKHGQDRRSYAREGKSAEMSESKGTRQRKTREDPTVQEITQERDGGKLDFLANPNHVRQLVRFLTIFGQEGVVLRELLMLASIRYLTKPQIPFATGFMFELTYAFDNIDQDVNFMSSFIHSIRRDGLDAIRESLLRNDLIKIKHDKHIRHRSWAADGQTWIATERSTYPREPYNIEAGFLQDLLHIFGALPDEGTRCVVIRRREIFYPFARVVCLHLSQKVFPLVQHSKTELLNINVLIRWVNLNFSLLMYKREPWDELLLRHTVSLICSYDSEPLVMSLGSEIISWVELKWTILDGSSAPPGDTPSEAAGRDHVDHQMSTIRSRLEHAKTGWDWRDRRTGWALVHLLQNAKDAGHHSAVSILRRTGREWCETVDASAGDLQPVLCMWLPELELLDRLADLPLEHHLDIGFNLSRSGYLALAHQYLRSGLHETREKLSWSCRWRLGAELIIVLMRLERWKDAWDEIEHLNLDFPKDPTTNDLGKDERAHVYHTMLLTGDHSESLISLSCLDADMYLAKNMLYASEFFLKQSLEICGYEQDPSLRLIRISVRSRLIKVQLNLRQVEGVVETSSRQIEDLPHSSTTNLPMAPPIHMSPPPGDPEGPILRLAPTISASNATEFDWIASSVTVAQAASSGYLSESRNPVQATAYDSAIEDLVTCVDELCDYNAFPEASRILYQLRELLAKSPMHIPENLQSHLLRRQRHIDSRLTSAARSAPATTKESIETASQSVDSQPRIMASSGMSSKPPSPMKSVEGIDVIKREREKCQPAESNSLTRNVAPMRAERHAEGFRRKAMSEISEHDDDVGLSTPNIGGNNRVKPERLKSFNPDLASLKEDPSHLHIKSKRQVVSGTQIEEKRTSKRMLLTRRLLGLKIPSALKKDEQESGELAIQAEQPPIRPEAIAS